MDHSQDHNRKFSALYRATLDPLRRYLARLLGNSGEAQDVAHDAYVRIYPKIEDHTAEKPEALLYTTARRLAFNRLKRRRISPISTSPLNLEFASAQTPGVVQEVIARQELARLESAIARLPAGCRSVLLLRKIELLPHQEIARRLGIAVSTVEKQHARALRLLRHELQTHEETESASEDLQIKRETSP
ncbi:MAG: RNA polymerase sigma factor [Cephaloticoccus sp.]|nr:RNA polymerase sigma factor [Cephaloticoccus sp.]MCF7759600.1 RNA polymerase sigma factor [Cephaloticoccus sp.]